MIEIKPANTKKEKQAFVHLPWDLYKDNPYWVAPLLMDVRQMFGIQTWVDKLLGAGKTHPFYEYGTLQPFLAYKGGKLVGRIAAILNPRYNEYQPDVEKVGFFGFFECVNDQEVANALFDAAKKWLQEKGMKTMHGPASPSSNYEYGLLIDNFEDSPRVDTPYAHKYYKDLYAGYGLPVAKVLYAYKMDAKTVASNAKLKRGMEAVKKRYNVELRPLNMKDLHNEVKKIKEVYNSAWEPNWGFIPLTEQEIDMYAEKFKLIADPEFIPFVYVNGKFAGMAAAVLDFNEILKSMKGHLFPFQFLKILTQKKKIQWMRVILLGILPEFQGKGIDAVVYYHLVETSLNKNLKFGEGSWILEDNEMMNRGMRVVNGEVYKRYNVYELDI